MQDIGSHTQLLCTLCGCVFVCVLMCWYKSPERTNTPHWFYRCVSPARCRLSLLPPLRMQPSPFGVCGD